MRPCLCASRMQSALSRCNSVSTSCSGERVVCLCSEPFSRSSMLAEQSLIVDVGLRESNRYQQVDFIRGRGDNTNVLLGDLLKTYLFCDPRVFVLVSSVLQAPCL